MTATGGCEKNSSLHRPPFLSDTKPVPCRPSCRQFRPAVLESQERLLRSTGVVHESRQIPLSLGCVANVVVCPRAAPGPVLVLLPGWGAGLGAYAFALPHLTQRFAIYAIDLPGMGASDRCPFPSVSEHEPDASINFFLAHLDSTFAALSATDAAFAASPKILGAHSLGGYLSALWMLRDQALDTPKFDSLILLSPVGVPERPLVAAPSPSLRVLRAVAQRLYQTQLTPQMLLRSAPRHFAKRFVAGYVTRRYEVLPHAAWTDALSSYLLEISLAPGASEVAFLTILDSGAWAKRPLVDMLPSLKCKVTFVYGAGDWMDAHPAHALAEVMQAEVKILKGGHNFHVSHCTEFADTVWQHYAS